MCGIWGIVYGPDGPAAEEWTPSEFAQICFPAITHRGPHAWGWMSYNGGDEISIRKSVGRADTKRAVRSMDVDPSAKWVVGHVRYATHGSPDNLLNDHPLVHGNIIGVHNGVIRNYADILKLTGRANPETEVDSEAIFAAIDKWGNVPGLNRIHGDMVAVYVDRRYPNTVRIARKQGRPLVMSRTPTGAIIFASEDGVIKATGIERSESSGVLPYRLLNLKEGKIVKRTNLDMPHEPKASEVTVSRLGERTPYRPSPGVINTHWHRQSYDGRLSPKANEMRNRIIAMCKEDERAAITPARRPAIRRTPNQTQKVQPNGTMDGNLYWYNGMLYDLDTYMDLMLGDID